MVFASVYSLDPCIEHLIIIAENDKGKTRSPWQGEDVVSQHSDRLLSRGVTIGGRRTDNPVCPLCILIVHSASPAHAHKCIDILGNMSARTSNKGV